MKHEIHEAWHRIAKWLKLHAPEILEQLQPPASQEQLDRFTSQIGLALVDDFKVFYQIFNGPTLYEDGIGIFPSCDEWDNMAFGPLSLAYIIQEWEMQAELLEEGDFEGLKPQSAEGIANVWWNVGWIPFADNGGGDYYCIDMAPTELGIKGQVISHSHETGEHKLLAKSLSAYLNDLANALDANRFEYDVDYGICRREIEN